MTLADPLAKLVATIALCTAGQLFMLATAGVVHGAEISTLHVAEIDFTLIMIKGEIVEGDSQRFRDISDSLEKATVVLESPGGLLRDALEIGAEIRIRNFATMVSADAECYSACALIWVAGARRYMSRSSLIGFHAAYHESNGEYLESGMANAEIGSFMAHLGYRIEAIRFFTYAGPTEFLLLTPEDARSLGIDVFLQDGFEVTTPQERPVVDEYASIFVHLAALQSRCGRYFMNKEWDAAPGIYEAFESAHELVSEDHWLNLWLMFLDVMKERFSKVGDITTCIEIESKLRDQGIETGIVGPSYDCSGALNATEAAICGDKDLWIRDRITSSIYFFVMKYGPKDRQTRIRSLQREWLKERNKCLGDVQCLSNIYDRRIANFKDTQLP